MKIFVNSLGLALSIIGTILLYKFGLPEQIDKNGNIHLILEQTDEFERMKAKKYDCFSKLALALIFLGFTLQLISNFISAG